LRCLTNHKNSTSNLLMFLLIRKQFYLITKLVKWWKNIHRWMVSPKLPISWTISDVGIRRWLFNGCDSHLWRGLVWCFHREGIETPTHGSCGCIVAISLDPIWEMEDMPFGRIMGVPGVARNWLYASSFLLFLIFIFEPIGKQ